MAAVEVGAEVEIGGDAEGFVVEVAEGDDGDCFAQVLGMRVIQ